MPKDSIKDKIDGKECDLSLSDLTVVPVKELAAVPKATHLDLSCNILTSLPDEFCQLTHLVKLDLSKNALSKLPENFGALTNLQYIDLFSNKLTTLPVSFCRLKSLRWLDVKDNQLNDKMRNVTGDCLDDIQCKQCAKNVVTFMKELDAERQRQIQKRLQEEREKEAELKAETERINRQRKEQKKAEKERKRKEYEAKMAKMKQEKGNGDHEEIPEPESEAQNGHKAAVVERKRGTGGIGCCGVLLAVFVALLAVAVGFYAYCQQFGDEEICRRAAFQVKKYQFYANQYLQKYGLKEY